MRFIKVNGQPVKYLGSIDAIQSAERGSALRVSVMNDDGNEIVIHLGPREGKTGPATAELYLVSGQGVATQTHLGTVKTDGSILPHQAKTVPFDASSGITTIRIGD